MTLARQQFAQVAHDIFLDGNTVKTSHSVDKEFELQDHSHSYGSLAISYTF